jgi:nicotinamidase-related amidase
MTSRGAVGSLQAPGFLVLSPLVPSLAVIMAVPGEKGILVTGTALLVMDLQRGIVDRHPDSAYLSRVQQGIAVARAAGLPVIYVVIGFRPGHPEVSPANQIFSAIAGTGRYADGDPAAEIHPDIAPAPGDVVVTKRRVSAFAGSDLELVLRSQGIDTLVLTGVATSGVVLSTLRQAADLDYRLTVLADACLDSDPEVHRVLTEKVFPRQATVTTVADWAPST